MASALVSWVQLPCCPKFQRSNKLVEKRQADAYGPIAPRGNRSSFRRLGPHKVSAYLADSVTESVSEVLRRVGVNPEERRLALILALGTQAGRRTEKGAQSVNIQARGPDFPLACRRYQLWTLSCARCCSHVLLSTWQSHILLGK
jgi:hypothetical protein